MKLRSYLIIMILGAIICWGAFAYVLFTVNPESTNWVGFTLFYSALFLALSGTIAILGFVIRFVALKNELVFNSVKNAFRQSFLFAFAAISILFLLANNYFSWANLILVVVGLSVLELFLLSYQK